MVQILLIDDDLIVQMVLRKILLEQGYEVIVTQDGQEGITLSKQLRPAVIICDWQMSGLDGLDVCRQIKSDPALAGTFFILLTSRTTVEDRVTGLDAGADDFLLKPIEVSELKARVRAGLRLYQAVQDLQKVAADLQIQKDLLELEFAEAADYVRSLLPPPMTGKVTITSRFLPSRQLGGDCFDYYWLDPDYLVIYLLDVSGHGLRSALPSAYVQNLLRSQSLESTNFYQPHDVLRSLNEIFHMHEHSNQYFTIWYGVYNHHKRQLVYATAGHPPAILLTANPGGAPQVQQLKASGFPIGMFSDAKYVSDRCAVDAYSTLYLFSDGIYEVTPLDGEMWTLAEFIDLLVSTNKIINPCPIDDIVQQVQALSGSPTFEDDCSLLQIYFG